MFGALVRTIVNVATLPVTLPVAVVKDAFDVMAGETDEVGRNTKEVVQTLKDEASEKADR